MNLRQRKAASDDGVQKVSEWPVVDPDSCSHARTGGLGRNGLPTGRRVARQDNGHDAVDVTRPLTGKKRGAKARVDTEVDEPPTWPQDAMGFAKGPARIVEVRVREERDDRVKLLIAERQPVRICTNELSQVSELSARALKLTLRYIYSHYRPSSLHERGNGQTGAGTDVEAPTSPLTKKAYSEVARVGMSLAARKGLVPRSLAVVAWCHHGEKESTTAWLFSVCECTLTIDRCAERKVSDTESPVSVLSAIRRCQTPVGSRGRVFANNP
jgi:hypothetical protein